MSTQDTLIIFDTTLRDGEQSPGASMNREEKVRIAKALERLKVDVIEAGFPIASQGDFEGVQAVARAVKGSTVCGLARALDKDIDRAAEALQDAESFRIHTFIATSPIHMQHKLRMTEDEVVEQAVRAVKRARQYTDDVEVLRKTRAAPSWIFCAGCSKPSSMAPAPSISQIRWLTTSQNNLAT